MGQFPVYDEIIKGSRRQSAIKEDLIMAGTTFFFLLLGVATVVTEFMRLLQWLDTPARRR